MCTCTKTGNLSFISFHIDERTLFYVFSHKPMYKNAFMINAKVKMGNACSCCQAESLAFNNRNKMKTYLVTMQQFT